jgi:hypothetical protein
MTRQDQINIIYNAYLRAEAGASIFRISAPVATSNDRMKNSGLTFGVNQVGLQSKLRKASRAIE